MKNNKVMNQIQQQFQSTIIIETMQILYYIFRLDTFGIFLISQ